MSWPDRDGAVTTLMKVKPRSASPSAFRNRNKHGGEKKAKNVATLISMPLTFTILSSEEWNMKFITFMATVLSFFFNCPF